MNLRDSNARDLWVYGVRTVRQQSELLAQLQAGPLTCAPWREQTRRASPGAGPALQSGCATRAHRDRRVRGWIAAEAPTKTGPSGVGKDNYNWYSNTCISCPMTGTSRCRCCAGNWSAHARASRSRSSAIATCRRLSRQTRRRRATLVVARMKKLTDFLIESGIVPDKQYFRDAMAHQVLDYVPPEKRNFFLQASAREPLGLFSHDYHWIELARMKEEPNGSPIRRLPALSNMFDSRSEGLATAMEETLMHAGLYDDNPRGREIVWIMLANRAARGLASLYVQTNQLTLQQAGRFPCAVDAARLVRSFQRFRRIRAIPVPASARLRHQLHHRQAPVRTARQRLSPSNSWRRANRSGWRNSSRR